MPQLNQGEIDNLETEITTAPANPDDSIGMIVYNTSINCLQLFSGTTFECFFLESDQEVGNSGAVRVDIVDPDNGNIGGREAANAGTGPAAAGGGDITHPGYISLAGGNLRRYISLDFDTDEVQLAPSPITNFPENEADPTIIFLSVADKD